MEQNTSKQIDQAFEELRNSYVSTFKRLNEEITGYRSQFLSKAGELSYQLCVPNLAIPHNDLENLKGLVADLKEIQGMSNIASKSMLLTFEHYSKLFNLVSIDRRGT